MVTKKETLKGTRREQELELHRRKTKRNRLVIISAVIAAIAGISIYFAPLGRTEENRMPVQAVWIEPHVVGDIVSIAVSEVENSRNVHFNVKAQGEDMNFMAYVLDGEIHVRANVCPPCRSIGFSLEEAVLICDRCATTFEAKTGEGIEGACVDFPKASVPYEINSSSIIMKGIDLIAAYQDTIEPGSP